MRAERLYTKLGAAEKNVFPRDNGPANKTRACHFLTLCDVHMMNESACKLVLQQKYGEQKWAYESWRRFA